VGFRVARSAGASSARVDPERVGGCYQGLGFGDSGLGFRVWGSSFEVCCAAEAAKEVRG